MTIEFKFYVGQSVKIKALGRPGTVLACAYRGRLSGLDFIEYRVVYWDGTRKDEWLLETEIEQ